MYAFTHTYIFLESGSLKREGFSQPEAVGAIRSKLIPRAPGGSEKVDPPSLDSYTTLW